jgi:hypothetical protein
MYCNDGSGQWPTLLEFAKENERMPLLVDAAWQQRNFDLHKKVSQLLLLFCLFILCLFLFW